VFGTKYVCWKPRPEEGPDYHAAPLQQYITTTSVKSKKELAAFAVWLDKVRDVNVVVNTMHPGMTKLHADTSKILTHLYKTGLSPAAAYAELPEANWVFPDADKFNVGTEVLELPHIVWR
jgi:hypothetical protein